MKQMVLGNFDQPWIPIVGLMIFVICFSVYAYWTFRSDNKGHYEEAAQIPLRDIRKVDYDKR